jgi:hypothetical protein
VDAGDELLDAVGAGAVLGLAVGEDVEDLEVAGAQTVGVEHAVDFADRAGVEGEGLPPAVHEYVVCRLPGHGGHGIRGFGVCCIVI